MRFTASSTVLDKLRFVFLFICCLVVYLFMSSLYPPPTVNETKKPRQYVHFPVMKRKHLFFTEPIYYANPKTYDHPTVAIVAAASRKFSKRSFVCVSSNETIKQKETLATLERITYTPACKWSTYLLTCSVVGGMTSFGVTTSALDKTLPLEFKPAETAKRAIVVCMSRMFLYENWQILIATLEIYRNYKTDLLVAYVDSIVAGLLEILRLYEKEGLVMIEPSIRIHYTEGMAYDPNIENEWGNQIIAYNHCLYKFRESAEFVVFADWDDVLIPRGYGSGMAASLRSLFAQDPDAGAFQLHRMSTEVHAASDPNDFDLNTTLTTMMVSTFFGAGKSIVIPNRIKGAWVHKPDLFEEGYILGRARTNESWFYHLRILRTYDKTPPYWLTIRPNELNITQLDNSFKEIFARTKLQKIFDDLPKRHVYLESMEQCYVKMARVHQLNTRKNCPSQALCTVPATAPVRCVNVVHQFKSFETSSFLTISHAPNWTYSLSETGCTP